MLTIGELARHVGVSPRTVRFYESRGLLPEAERDGSGYRRYGAGAVVDLIRIRTLADAGVPLARIKELLSADADEFEAALVEIDKDLRAQIRQRERHRTSIKALANGEEVAVPTEVTAYLIRMQGLGAPPAAIDAERDAWIVVAALAPESIGPIIADKTAQLDDPAIVDLYLTLYDAAGWGPDDPRLPALADKLVAAYERGERDDNDAYAEFSEVSGPAERILDSMMRERFRAADQLLRLLEERGWTGWTNQRRIC